MIGQSAESKWDIYMAFICVIYIMYYIIYAQYILYKHIHTYIHTHTWLKEHCRRGQKEYKPDDKEEY